MQNSDLYICWKSSRTITARFSIGSTTAIVSASWFGAGLYDVSVSFNLIGSSGHYSFKLSSDQQSTTMAIAPGTYKVSSIIAGGRDGKNGTNSFLEATPSNENFTVAAGGHQSISIRLNVPSSGGGSFLP